MESSSVVRFAAKVIAIHGDKVLCVIYHRDGLEDYIDFPGGGIEPGEHELTTCARELAEETGLEAEGLKFVGRVLNVCPQKVFSIQVYVSHSITGAPHNPEGDAAEWLPIGYVRRYPKRLPITHLIDLNMIDLLEGEQEFTQHFISDSQSNILYQKTELAP